MHVIVVAPKLIYLGLHLTVITSAASTGNCVSVTACSQVGSSPVQPERVTYHIKFENHFLFTMKVAIVTIKFECGQVYMFSLMGLSPLCRFQRAI